MCRRDEGGVLAGCLNVLRRREDVRELLRGQFPCRLPRPILRSESETPGEWGISKAPSQLERRACASEPKGKLTMLSPRTISTPSGSSMTGSSTEKMRSIESARIMLVVWSKPISLPCRPDCEPKTRVSFSDRPARRETLEEPLMRMRDARRLLDHLV